MKKDDRPSEHFVGAMLRAFDKAEAQGGTVTCSKMWDYVVMECFRISGGFKIMFAWDTSKAQSINRIGTIEQCISRGYVPGLAVDDGFVVMKEDA